MCDRDTSAYPRLPVSEECSDKLSEPRSAQAGVERTTRSQTTEDTCWISHRNRFCVPPSSMECYGIGEMPAPNHKGQRTSGGSYGDDTDSDGASLTGPQPYTGEETRVSPVCCRFPLSAGWNLERYTRRKSHGGIPRPSGRGGGQSLIDCFAESSCAVPNRFDARCRLLSEQITQRAIFVSSSYRLCI